MQHHFPSKILEKLCRIADAIDSVIKTLEQLEQARCIVGSDTAYRAIVNEKLTNLARREHGIELPRVINFTGIAEKSARDAGLFNPSSDAFILLDLILTRKPKTTDLHGLSKDYARSTVMASLVRHLKSKGLSFEQIMNHPKVQEIRDRYSIMVRTIERYYTGNTLPNKEIDVERLWKAKGRSSLFENFEPSRGSFSSYLAVALRNEARDLKRQIDRETDVLSKAVRIKDPLSGDSKGLDSERSMQFAAPPSNEVDTKLMVERFRHELTKRDPKFLQMLRLIQSQDLDPFNERHLQRFQNGLNLTTRAEFIRFRTRFFEDLKNAFKEVEADNSEALTLLKIASAHRRDSKFRYPREQAFYVPKLGKHWGTGLGTKRG